MNFIKNQLLTIDYVQFVPIIAHHKLEEQFILQIKLADGKCLVTVLTAHGALGAYFAD